MTVEVERSVVMFVKIMFVVARRRWLYGDVLVVKIVGIVLVAYVEDAADSVNEVTFDSEQLVSPRVLLPAL